MAKVRSDMEEWIPLQDYPGYSVSSMGRIRNDRRESYLAIVRTESGHTFVGIMKEGRQVKRAVARLVCEAFLPKPHRASFNTPIHLDGDTSNCRIENLMWRPRWFAHKYTRQFKLKHPRYPPIRNKSTGEIFMDCWQLVRRDGLLYSDLVISTSNFSCVFPTMEFYEWVE